MKKHLKWIIPVICIVCSVTITSIIFQKKHRKIPTEIQYIHAVSMINFYDPREVVGEKDYVFIGIVEETHDYFTEKDKREFPASVTDYNRPITECNVKVIKNIKGTLKEGISFPFYKGGGVSKDYKYIVLYENDFIPEIGKYYIFTGYAHEDGTVTGGGPNGTVALEDGITAENLESSKLYQEYVDAYENQILPKYSIGYSYLAKNDVNFGNGEYNQKLYQKELKEEAEKAKKEKASLNAE